MARYPDFYDSTRIGTLFHPDASRIAFLAAAAGLAPAGEDARRVMLLIIDMQVDFCHEQGALYVPGALADIKRLIEFIYRYAERISRIACSLDSHLPFQIFHPAWWVDASGKQPAPFTIISVEDVETKRWQPVVQPDWSVEYVRRLEHEARKQLTIWPYHVPLGGVGNALDPELWSAVFWHAVARDSQPLWRIKGNNPRTEHYSIIKPEIADPGEPGEPWGQDFIRTIEEYDELVIAGEAESHCVLETVEDLVRVFRWRPDQLAKVRILTDCTSPVAHPQIDYHAIARARFKEIELLGVKLATSEDPL